MCLFCMNICDELAQILDFLASGLPKVLRKGHCLASGGSDTTVCTDHEGSQKVVRDSG